MKKILCALFMAVMAVDVSCAEYSSVAVRCYDEISDTAKVVVDNGINVYFDNDGDSFPTVDGQDCKVKFKEYMQTKIITGNEYVILFGLTDELGSDDHNKDLSARRAKNVRSTIKELSVQPRFVHLYSAGEAFGWFKNVDANQHYRAVVVYVIKNEEGKPAVQIETELNAILNLYAKINTTYSSVFDIERSVWKTADGKFNTARLLSDSIAGVVLGTAGGLITANVVKKNQIENGFEDMRCTVGGQSVADWGDEFSVGRK